MSLALNKWAQRTSGPVAHLRLFVLSKCMITIFKTETYGHGRWQFEKPLVSVS